MASLFHHHLSPTQPIADRTRHLPFSYNFTFPGPLHTCFFFFGTSSCTRTRLELRSCGSATQRHELHLLQKPRVSDKQGQGSRQGAALAGGSSSHASKKTNPTRLQDRLQNSSALLCTSTNFKDMRWGYCESGILSARLDKRLQKAPTTRTRWYSSSDVALGRNPPGYLLDRPTVPLGPWGLCDLSLVRGLIFWYLRELHTDDWQRN